MPRRPRTAAAGLLICALAATLAGCSDTTRIPDPTPEATADPLFASDEEALAAAVEVYERYLDVSAQILSEGGANPERLQPLVSDEIYELELEDFLAAGETNYQRSGSLEVVDSQLQQRIQLEDSVSEEVAAYVCVSRESIVILDQNGESVTNPDAPIEYAFEIVTTLNAEGGVLESANLWDGFESCGG